MYITCERFAKMGAEFSTLTVEKDENPNIKNRFFVKIDKETIVVVYTNPPNETYSKPSSSLRFTKGDGLMFCRLNALKHAGFHPYKSNGIGAGFSFIVEEGVKTQTFYNMHEMKKTVNGETCYWNPDTKTLNIPNKCLTFEEIKKLFSEIKRDNTIQPVFTKNEEDFPVIPNSRTSSPTPTLVKEENSDDAVVDAPADAPADAHTDVPPPVIVNGMPMVLPTYTYIPVNGMMSQFNTITNKVMVYIGNDPVWLPLSHKNE